MLSPSSRLYTNWTPAASSDEEGVRHSAEPRIDCRQLVANAEPVTVKRSSKPNTT